MATQARIDKTARVQSPKLNWRQRVVTKKSLLPSLFMSALGIVGFAIVDPQIGLYVRVSIIACIFSGSVIFSFGMWPFVMFTWEWAIHARDRIAKYPIALAAVDALTEANKSYQRSLTTARKAEIDAFAQGALKAQASSSTLAGRPVTVLSKHIKDGRLRLVFDKGLQDGVAHDSFIALYVKATNELLGVLIVNKVDFAQCEGVVLNATSPKFWQDLNVRANADPSPPSGVDSHFYGQSDLSTELVMLLKSVGISEEGS